MPHWIWEDVDWPNFTWDADHIQPLLGKARLLQGKLLGVLRSFDEKTREGLNLKALTDEMVTTSAIEGSVIDRESVRSSIYHRLGIGKSGITTKPDRYVEGLLDIMIDATDHHDHLLTVERLCGWHAALFPTGYSGMQKILVGQLRGEGDMKIISGRTHKMTVHYLAPPKKILPKEMRIFLKWFNKDSLKKETIDGLIRAAIAHLWFERIHPFDDGNGRIGRAIIDMALAQDEKNSMRYYSLSSVIMDQRKSYDQVLDTVSKGGLNVTVWVEWFLNCFITAIENAFQQIDKVLQKTVFWQKHEQDELNERQKKVLNKMLEKGANEYIGGMTTQKYASITKTSRATAYRELNDLVKKKCIRPLKEKGRSAAYEIIWPK
jgi:Fic family protein